MSSRYNDIAANGRISYIYRIYIFPIYIGNPIFININININIYIYIYIYIYINSTQNVNNVMIEKPICSSKRLPPDNYRVNSLIPFETYSNVTFAIKLS